MIVNRPGAEAFKTYEIIAPLSTHYRPASCLEVGCRAYENGWQTRLLPGTPEHSMVLSLKGKYVYTGPVRQEDGTDVFTFAPGQPCFRTAQHRVSVEREPFYVVRGGDARGNPRGERASRTARDWVDDFAEHQDKIASARERG